jgi:hypothetical protein
MSTLAEEETAQIPWDLLLKQYGIKEGDLPIAQDRSPAAKKLQDERISETKKDYLPPNELVRSQLAGYGQATGTPPPLPSYQEQMLGIADLQSKLKAAEDKPVNDYSMLASAGEWLTGAPLTKMYRPEFTAAQKQAAQDKLQDQLLRARQGLSSADVGILKAMRPIILPTGQTVYQKGTKDDADRGGNKDLWKEVEKLQKNIGDTFPGVIQTFNELDAEIGGIDNWDKSKDIPGAGKTGLIASKLPFLVSSKGQRISQLVADLSNQLIYLRSGKAITPSEYTRLSRALGSGAFQSDAELVSGLKNFRSLLKRIIQSKEAGYRPEVQKLYWDSPGAVKSSDIVIPSENTAEGKPAAAAGGKVDQAKLDRVKAMLNSKKK